MGGRDYHDIENDSDHEVAVEDETGGPSAVLRRCNAVSVVITIIGVLVGLLIILLVTLALLASFDVIDFQKDLSDVRKFSWLIQMW